MTFKLYSECAIIGPCPFMSDAGSCCLSEFELFELFSGYDPKHKCLQLRGASQLGSWESGINVLHPWKFLILWMVGQRQMQSMQSGVRCGTAAATMMWEKEGIRGVHVGSL